MTKLIIIGITIIALAGCMSLEAYEALIAQDNRRIVRIQDHADGDPKGKAPGHVSGMYGQPETQGKDKAGVSGQFDGDL